MAVTYRSYNTSTSKQVNFHHTGLNTYNMGASLVYVPEGGMIAESISVYWAGRGGTAIAHQCIWDSAGSGEMIVRTGTVSSAAGSDTLGGQRWHTASITPTYLQGGKNYFVGIWCNPTYPRYVPQWSNGAVNGNLYHKTASSLTDYSNNHIDNRGVLACYITGRLVGGKVWNGSSWVDSKGVYVWTGSGWAPSKSVKVWTGSAWVDAK